MTAKEFLLQYDIDYAHSLDQKGLGSVYTAEEKISGILYALKVIELHPFFDKGEILKRFKNAILLSHKNLLKYTNVIRYPSEESIQHFIIMPYVSEGTLLDKLESLNFHDKIAILNQILDALNYLHKNDVIWQSLRSDHILLPSNQGAYVPKIINYGAVEKIPSTFFSNYEYLAPEQLTDDDLECTPSTDIWAFGVLAYEIFTGKLPFGRKSPLLPNKKIMERILEGDYADLFDKIPDAYKHVIRKCLKVPVEQRWENIENIRTFLNEEQIKPISVKDVTVVDTLLKMGEDDESYANVSKSETIPIFQRTFKRKPSKPIRWWEPIIWLVLATLIGYLLSKL